MNQCECRMTVLPARKTAAMPSPCQSPCAISTAGRRAMKLMAGLATSLSLLTAAASAPAQPACVRGTGTHDGYFYTSWRDSGDVCMTLREAGHYTVAWDLAGGGNMVVGKGWETGSTGRTVGYRAAAFEPGSNGYLTLYGWTTEPLIEYYVVDGWGTDFTPPGEDAAVLGTVDSDDGTYRIYRT